MAQPTNTFAANDAKGIREDLSNIIYRIDPTEVPFSQLASRTGVKHQSHEWQTQALATASATNAVIEGDDATMDAVTATVRMNNRTQISDKTATITGTLEAVDKAGRDSEMEYQILLKGLELRRDIEAALTQNNALVVGTDGTAPRSASLESWLSSATAGNTLHGAGGATTGWTATDTVAAPTDGTQRAFTLALLNTACSVAFTAGGNPKYLMLGASQKQVFSGFASIAVNRLNLKGVEQGAVISGADVFQSDFGMMDVIPNRFQRNRTAFVLDMTKWKLGFLRPMKNWELAKTGDTEKRQVLAEYVLEACNPAASTKVADLN